MTLVYLTIAWMGGILLAKLLWSQGWLACPTPGWPFAALAAIALAAAVVWRERPRERLAAVLILAVLLGAWRYQAQPYAACSTPADLAFYNGTEEEAVRATVEGVVVAYPDVRDVQTQYRLRAATVTLAGRTLPVGGDVLVQAQRFPEYHYGDRLRVSGQLQTPPVLDDFDYRAYLAQRGIRSLMRRAQIERVAEGKGNWFWGSLYAVKTRSSALLNCILPEPAAALANGMLLGIESGIPDDVDEAFKATGTSHVIVISGSNIALLSGVLMAGLSHLLGKRRAVWPAILAITVYVLLVGADAAALRAGLMGILYIIAIYLGRQSTAYVSLCASALLMTLHNPLTLWDIGFQLSFMATLGLVLFTDGITLRFTRLLARRLAQERVQRVMAVLNDALIVTLAAQTTTLPLIVLYFGRVSLISFVTNFLILPAQPPIMNGGMLTVIGGLVWEPLGRVLAVIPWLFLTYTTAIVRLTAAVPFASVETGALGRVAAGVYFAVLFGSLLWRKLQQQGWAMPPLRPVMGWAAALGVPLWLTASLLLARPDGKLHLFFVPGTAGEAALVVTPNGRYAWAWDGRGDGEALVAATAALLPRRGQPVDAALGPGAAALWPSARPLDPTLLAPGAGVRLDAGVTLTRLPADDGWLLSYNHFRTLLPTTLGPATQAALIRAGAELHATVLKAPDPDTGAWPTAAFLAAAAPQLILWPDETTYPPDVDAHLAARSVQRIPAEIIVEVITDGRLLWLKQRSISEYR